MKDKQIHEHYMRSQTLQYVCTVIQHMSKCITLNSLHGVSKNENVLIPVAKRIVATLKAMRLTVKKIHFYSCKTYN